MGRWRMLFEGFGHHSGSAPDGQANADVQAKQMHDELVASGHTVDHAVFVTKAENGDVTINNLATGEAQSGHIDDESGKLVSDYEIDDKDDGEGEDDGDADKGDNVDRANATTDYVPQHRTIVGDITVDINKVIEQPTAGTAGDATGVHVQETVQSDQGAALNEADQGGIVNQEDGN